MTKIVEDRVLARVAFEAVAWNVGTSSAQLADMAFGQAMIALRVLDVRATPEITRTVADDIALVLADPAMLARAQAFSLRVVATRHANLNEKVTLRSAVG